MKLSGIVFLTVVLSFTSCDQPSTIEGLWVVKSVMVGEKKMTPNARWTRFHADQTQESGNGRFQHSYGLWELNQNKNELFIISTNGLEDSNPPFMMTLGANEMIWERIEEGQHIKVHLERSTQLPETYADKILGLWLLEKATGNGPYFMESDTNENNEYLFIRWDKRFVIGTKKGKVHGVYNVHGHKPELELIPYSTPLKRDFWRIEFAENLITLKLLNSDSLVTRQFKRVHKFPNK